MMETGGNCFLNTEISSEQVSLLMYLNLWFAEHLFLATTYSNVFADTLKKSPILVNPDSAPLAEKRLPTTGLTTN